MRSLADFEFNKAPLCEGMILACEAIRRDFPSQDVYDELERLVSLAKEEISQLLPLEEQVKVLFAINILSATCSYAEYILAISSS